LAIQLIEIFSLERAKLLSPSPEGGGLRTTNLSDYIPYLTHAKKKDFVKITFFRRQVLFLLQLLKQCNDGKKTVKVTKNDCYFNRYGL